MGEGSHPPPFGKTRFSRTKGGDSGTASCLGGGRKDPGLFVADIGQDLAQFGDQRVVLGQLIGALRGAIATDIGLFYRSANFDEDVFDHPERFDIRRDPNPHVGLGGFGAHYCLGASLAKLEIGLIFNAIADAMPDIRKAGQPERLRSGWLNGIKHLPVSYAAS